MDTLQFITIQPNFEITFSELVDILGPPNYVEEVPVDRVNHGLAVQWIDLQLIAGAPIERKDVESFRRTLLIDPDLIVDEFIIQTHRLTNNRDRFVEHPWSGFISD